LATIPPVNMQILPEGKIRYLLVYQPSQRAYNFNRNNNNSLKIASMSKFLRALISAYSRFERSLPITLLTY